MKIQRLLWQSQSFSMLLMILLQVLISPAFACQCRAKESSVKFNMHTLQTLLETYALDWSGRFPSSLFALQRDAKAKKYWKDVINPFDSGAAFSDNKSFHHLQNLHHCHTSIWGISVRFDDVPCSITNALPALAGKVVYELHEDSQTHQVHYFIYGLDMRGNFIEDKQKPYYLSNS